MELHVASRAAELQPYRDAWASLLAGRSESDVASTCPWIQSWYEAFAADGEVAAWLFLRDGSLSGVAPLVCRPAARRIESAANLHSVYWDLISREPEQLLEAVCDGLRERQREWDVVRFLRVPAESPLARSGPEVFARRGFRLRRVRIGQNAVLGTDGDWKAWTAAHKSLTRDTRLKQRRLEKLGRVEFTTHGSREHLDDELTRFFEIEAAAWKGDAGSAIQCSEELLRFYSRLSERTADERWLALRFLEVDGRAIASQYWLAVGGTAYLIKLGYDPEYSRYSPGNLLLYDTLKGWFSDPEIDRVDWGPTGPRSWKERWGGEARPVYEVSLHARSLRGRALFGGWRLRDALRTGAVAKLARGLRDRFRNRS
jgi:CelD/BcsL family acetyltransferase involved in cellulose biosynthesis